MSHPVDLPTDDSQDCAAPGKNAKMSPEAKVKQSASLPGGGPQRPSSRHADSKIKGSGSLADGNSGSLCRVPGAKPLLNSAAAKGMAALLVGLECYYSRIGTPSQWHHDRDNDTVT